MKSTSSPSILLAPLLVLASSTVLPAASPAQETGSIIGWGEQILLEEAVLDSVVNLAVCGGHNLALRADGSIAAWGHNDYAQSEVPPPNAGFAAVAAGRYHGLALTDDGAIVA